MVQMLVHHKWFIRAGLAVFWAAEVIAWAFDYGFITYLLTYHTWIMLGILFLTFKYLLEPFYAPFIKITRDGGDIVMEKSTKVLLFFSAILGALVVAMAIEPSRNFIINAFQQGIANPVYYAGVEFNTLLGTYPALWILGSGLLGGLLLAIVVNTFVRPRLSGKKIPISRTPFTAQREPVEPESPPPKMAPVPPVKTTEESPKVEEATA